MERVMCATKGVFHSLAHRRSGLMLLRTDKFNALATDLDLHVVDQAEADIVYPVGGASQVWQHHLQVDTVDQITVAADLSSYATAEACGAIDDYTPPFGVFSGI